MRAHSFSSLPLDTAPNTRLLIAVDRLSSEYRVDRGTQVATGDRFVATGAAVVELTRGRSAAVPG